MSVSEDDDLEGVVALQFLCGEHLQRLGSQSISFVRRPLVAFAPGEQSGQPHAQVGVEHAEHPAEDPRPQDPARDAVAMVAAAEAVTVGNEGGAPGQRGTDRRPVERDPDLVGQARAAPPVVVATQERDRDTGVHGLRDRAQHAHMAARDRPPVLEPEVEDVAVQDHVRGTSADVAQPVHEIGRARARFRPEVRVAHHIGGLWSRSRIAV